MPNYDTGNRRFCAVCGKILNATQIATCSRSCQAVNHPAAKRVARLMPSDDEIWACRDSMTWADWADVTGLSPATTRKWARRRGFGRPPNIIKPRLTHAPCKSCGESCEVEKLSQERTCSACEGLRDAPRGPTLVELERARRIEPTGDRYEHWVRLPRRVIQSKHAPPGIAA